MLNRTGVLYALGAYTLWGFFPLYWHLLQGIPSTEILVHRVLWSFAFYFGLLKFRKTQIDFKVILKPAILTKIGMAALFISANWLLYIHAVNTGHVIESSLGYFMNPLVNVFLGFLILKEKLSRLSWIAVFVAAIGVVVLTLRLGQFPWIAVLLAVTFGLYGLTRKKIQMDALTASCIETGLMLIPSLVMIFYFIQTTPQVHAVSSWVLLALGGVITGVPLLWFAEAAQRLPLSSLGFFQYIAPTFQFLSGVLFFKEEFTRSHLWGFVFIWLALLIFVFEKLRGMKKKSL